MPPVVAIIRGTASVWVLLTAGLLSAQSFNSPTTVSSGDGLAGDPSFVLDASDNAIIVFVEEGEVYLAVGPRFLSEPTQFTDNDLEHFAPTAHASPSATLTVAYEEEDPSDGAEGSEVLYRTNYLGILADPENLSENLAADRTPHLSRSDSSARSIAWVRDEAGLATIQVAVDLGTPEELGEGENPSGAVGVDGSFHLVYERGGDIYYNRHDGFGFGSEVTVTSGSATDSAPSLRVNDDGEAQVAFVRDGDVFIVFGDEDARFGSPINLSESDGDSTNPQLAMSSILLSTVLYEEDGDLWLVDIINGLFVTDPVNITSSPEIEEHATLDIDSLGWNHVLFLREGDVYYMNDAPPPVVEIAADPTTGEAPLEVSFTRLGSGVVTAQVWDFGDGTIASEANPVHLFDHEGVFTVTLTLFGPGGTATAVYEDLIDATPPQTFMSIPPIRVFQGEPDVVVPVLGTHVLPSQGFQVAASYDGTAIVLEEISTAFTNVTTLSPEFVAINIVEDEEESWFTLGLVLDFLPPFDGRVLAVGADQRLVNLHLAIEFLAPAPATTVINLRNDLSDPPIQNLFTVDDDGFALSALASLTDGEIEVLPFEFPPPAVFIRGDSNGDSSVSILDALHMLQYFFQNGTAPACKDQADSNDDGILGIADAIVLLNYLFTGGAILPYPFPSYGLDPTSDGLGDC